jgi:hypothetical protein
VSGNENNVIIGEVLGPVEQNSLQRVVSLIFDGLQIVEVSLKTGKK